MKSSFVRVMICSVILAVAGVASSLFAEDVNGSRIAGVDSVEAKEGHITIHLGSADNSTTAPAVDSISEEARVCGIITAVGFVLCLDHEYTFNAQPLAFIFPNRVFNFLVSIMLLAYVVNAASWAFAGVYHPIIRLLKSYINDTNDKTANLTLQELFVAGLKNWPQIRKFVAPEYLARGDALYNEFLQKAVLALPRLQLTDVQLAGFGAPVTQASATPTAPATATTTTVAPVSASIAPATPVEQTPAPATPAIAA
jgi:hypothetical protein